MSTVHVSLSEADIARSSVSSHSFTCPSASGSDPGLYATSKITPRPGTRLPWTEVFVPCEPFQSPLCVSKLMSLYVLCLQDVFFLLFLNNVVCLSAQLQVRGGLEEARVAVLLHQGVDFGLGQIETGLAGVLHVLLGDGFGHMVQIHLWRSRGGREVIISTLQ